MSVIDSNLGQIMTQLAIWIRRQDLFYYACGRSEVPDSVYDERKLQLENLEKTHPELVTYDSPLAKVGHPEVDNFAAVGHASPMLSLEKCKDVGDLSAWLLQNFRSGDRWVIEPKLDGMALSLIYRGHHLRAAITRGDGTTGADVTNNALVTRGIPRVITDPGFIEVRGEVCMPFRAFEALNARLTADGEEPFANPRNAAAGSLKSHNQSEAATRGLVFYAYQIVRADVAAVPDVYAWLRQNHFATANDVNPVFPQTIDGVPEMTAAGLAPRLAALEPKLAHSLVATDGLVIKVLNLDRIAAMGASNTAPRYARAFKFPPARVRTTLLGIELTIGRTGVVIPNARLRSVLLEGTTVSNASLCNQDEVERLGISVGDEVWVQKSGLIIPKVVGLAEKRTGEKHWSMPETYADKSGRVFSISKRRAEDVHRYLTNAQTCWEVAAAQLRYVTSKGVLDWDGCGEVQIEKLMIAGARTLPDLFSIDPSSALKGKEKERFLKSRSEVVSRDIWRWVAAVAPEGFGKTSSKVIAKLSGDDLDKLPDIPQELIFAALGTVKTEQWFSALNDTVGVLKQLPKISKSEKSIGTLPLTGMVFCITGALSVDRPEMERRLESMGALCKGSCGKATTYLVVGADPGATKTKAAVKFGVPQITEQQLNELILSKNGR